MEALVVEAVAHLGDRLVHPCDETRLRIAVVAHNRGHIAGDSVHLAPRIPSRLAGWGESSLARFPGGGPSGQTGGGFTLDARFGRRPGARSVAVDLAPERVEMHMGERAEGRGVNRLAGETSPYLLQHADNPVDWYPVMAHESFEDPDTAALMNEHFVSVKVDREERPDVDAIYMSAVQAMTGHGGWPMTMYLTPDGKPFYGA